MPFAPPRLARLVFFFSFAAALPPCEASNTVTSSASSAASESADSASTSIEKSSNSSSQGGKVAAGDYKIIHMAATPERPGMWRLNLRAVAGGAGLGEFFLYLPQTVVDRTPLAEGGIVTARARPYGLELVQGAQQQAFFLVLDDDWHRDLQTRALAL